MATLGELLGTTTNPGDGPGMLGGGSYVAGGGDSQNPFEKLAGALLNGVTYAGIKVPMAVGGAILSAPANALYRVAMPITRELVQGADQLWAQTSLPGSGNSRKNVAARKAAGINGFRLNELLSTSQKAGGDLFKNDPALQDNPKYVTGALEQGFRIAADPLNLLGSGEMNALTKAGRFGLKEAERLSAREMAMKIAETAARQSDQTAKFALENIASTVLREGKGGLTKEMRNLLTEHGLAANPTLVFGLGKKAIQIPGTENLAQLVNQGFKFGGLRGRAFDWMVEHSQNERKLVNGFTPVGRELRNAASKVISGEQPGALLTAIPSIAERRSAVGHVASIMEELKRQVPGESGLSQSEIQLAQRTAQKSADHGASEAIQMVSAMIKGEEVKNPTPMQRMVKALIDLAEKLPSPSGIPGMDGVRFAPNFNGEATDLKTEILSRLQGQATALARQAPLKNRFNSATAFTQVQSVLDDAVKATYGRAMSAQDLMNEVLSQGINHPLIMDMSAVDPVVRDVVDVTTRAARESADMAAAHAGVVNAGQAYVASEAARGRAMIDAANAVPIDQYAAKTSREAFVAATNPEAAAVLKANAADVAKAAVAPAAEALAPKTVVGGSDLLARRAAEKAANFERSYIAGYTTSSAQEAAQRAALDNQVIQNLARRAKSAGMDAEAAKKAASQVLAAARASQLPIKAAERLHSSEFIANAMVPDLGPFAAKFTELSKINAEMRLRMLNFTKEHGAISLGDPKAADAAAEVLKVLDPMKARADVLAKEIDFSREQIAAQFGTLANALSVDAATNARGAEWVTGLVQREGQYWEYLNRLKTMDELRAKMAAEAINTAAGQRSRTLVAAVGDAAAAAQSRFDASVETGATRIRQMIETAASGKKGVTLRPDLTEGGVADMLRAVAMGGDPFAGVDADMSFLQTALAVEANHWYQMGGGRYMHEDLWKFITRTRQVTSDPSDVLKDFNGATKVWRAQILASPGFSNRNFFGGWLQNLQDGVSLRHYRDMATVFKDYLNPDTGVPVVGGSGVGHFGPKSSAILARHNMTPADAERLIGEIGHTLGRGLGETSEFEPNRVLHRLEKIQSFLDERALGKTVMTLGKADKVPVEMNLRMAHVAAQMEQGQGFRQAMDRMYLLHNDYTDLSKLDIMAKRLYPFWMFRTRNLVHQAQLLATSNAPGRTLQRIAFQTQAEAQNNDMGIPPFLSPSVIGLDGGARFLGLGGISGSGDAWDQVLNFGNAVQQGNLGQIFKTVFAPDGMNPVAQIPIELATNTDIYTGQPLFDQTKSGWGNTAKYLLNQALPIYSTVDRGINSPSIQGGLWRLLALNGAPVPRQYQQNK